MVWTLFVLLLKITGLAMEWLGQLYQGLCYSASRSLRSLSEATHSLTMTAVVDKWNIQAGGPQRNCKWNITIVQTILSFSNSSVTRIAKNMPAYAKIWCSFLPQTYTMSKPISVQVPHNLAHCSVTLIGIETNMSAKTTNGTLIIWTALRNI